MSLLECLVGIALCALLLNPLLKTSADLVIKQIEFEKTQSLISEADRAFELIGRAIRMAGYRNIQNTQIRSQTSGHKTNAILFLEVNKKSGFRGSDALTIRHELSDGVDFDCIGNVLTKDRTKNHLAMQGFLVDRQAGVPKGQKVNGGSLICQSLDRQGRIQNTTLMNGINGLFVEELNAAQTESMKGQRLFKIKLQMTDGAKLNMDLERIFATRNLL
jgi:type II secretory pathway component PulJ